MRLILAGVGRLKAGPERELFARYLSRAQAIGRSAGVSTIEAFEIGEARARTASERMREEAAALQTRIPAGAFLIAFDERGTSFTSDKFAAMIGGARDSGEPAIALAAGGPDGLHEAFRISARAIFAFGAATLPHQLVRVLLAEQVYRALTILAGHPYHRA